MCVVRLDHLQKHAWNHGTQAGRSKCTRGLVVALPWRPAHQRSPGVPHAPSRAMHPSIHACPPARFRAPQEVAHVLVVGQRGGQAHDARHLLCGLHLADGARHDGLEHRPAVIVQEVDLHASRGEGAVGAGAQGVGASRGPGDEGWVGVGLIGWNGDRDGRVSWQARQVHSRNQAPQPAHSDCKCACRRQESGPGFPSCLSKAPAHLVNDEQAHEVGVRSVV